jgi:hypothetical protein
MDDDSILIDTIIEARSILDRHVSREHASAEDTISQLLLLLDSGELVKALAERGHPVETGWKNLRPC